MRIRALSLIVCIAGLAGAGAASASAATPGAVSIRVEGGATTLVPARTVTTTTTPVDKAGHACSGTSIGGALEAATNGGWGGGYDPSYGQQLEVVLGESHTFSSGSYYALYVNGKAASMGVCTTELQPGDSVLVYAACAGATTNCFSGEPLVATAPATAAPGSPFTVSVAESTTTYGGAPDYAATTTTGPSSGATVAGGGLSAQTGADGRATLTATQRGPLDLLVTKPDQVRQDVIVCITDGADGYCGTTKPGDPPPATTAPPACFSTGSDGLCGSPDTTAPVASIQGIREQARFRRGHAPTTLHGKVAPDPAGLQDVRLRLTRTRGPRCSFYDGALERFVRAKVCGARGGRFFSVGDRAPWSYLLPFDLPAGRYVLDVRAVDKAGNASRLTARGVDRIVFTVA